MRSVQGWRAFAAGVALLMLSGRCAAGAEAEDAASRWWGGIGVGYGHLQADSSWPIPAHANGSWIELGGGMRLTEHWLLGIEFSGMGLHFRNANRSPAAPTSSAYRNTISPAVLLLSYVPHPDSGWNASAGAGVVMYDTKDEDDYDMPGGHGPAALARIGYDWRLMRYVLAGIDLNYQIGRIKLQAPFTGKVRYSMLALDLRLAFR
jgi:hypothetical protein